MGVSRTSVVVSTATSELQVLETSGWSPNAKYAGTDLFTIDINLPRLDIESIKISKPGEGEDDFHVLTGSDTLVW